MIKGNCLLTREDGFTLMELMLVMIIIAILAVTVFVQFVNVSDSAKTAACITNQEAMEAAINVYWAEFLEYPAVIDELAPYMSGGTIPECPGDGIYSLVNANAVICSIPEHQ